MIFHSLSNYLIKLKKKYNMNHGVINLKSILEDAQMICDCIGHGKYER